MGDVTKKDHNLIINSAFQAILDNTKDMMFIKDANLRYVAASMPFVNMMGKTEICQVVGSTDDIILEDKNLAKRYVADDRKLMAAREDLIDYIEPIPDIDGEARYGTTSKFVLRNPQGDIIGILGITRDITREYKARQYFQHELKCLFELPEEAYAISYIDVDSWRVISQRRQEIGTATMEACNTVEELCDAAVDAIVDKKSDAYKFYLNFTPDRLREVFYSGKNSISFRYERRLTDGNVKWVHNKIRFITDVDNGHLCVLLTARDIDAEKKAEHKLRMDAKMDKMTMLLNRDTTMSSIRKILNEDAGKPHVLFMLDIDNFKTLNDTYGHQTGDEFLVELARELKTNFRDSDVLGRIGGDEFFALMRNVPDMSVVPKKADDILESIKTISGKYENIILSGSIGISVYPENGDTVDMLYSKADEALYQAKRRGKNQFIFASK